MGAGPRQKGCTECSRVLSDNCLGRDKAHSFYYSQKLWLVLLHPLIGYSAQCTQTHIDCSQANTQQTVSRLNQHTLPIRECVEQQCKPQEYTTVILLKQKPINTSSSLLFCPETDHRHEQMEVWSCGLHTDNNSVAIIEMEICRNTDTTASRLRWPLSNCGRIVQQQHQQQQRP